MITQQTPIAFSGSIPGFYDSFLGPMFFAPNAIDMANRISKLKAVNLLELSSGTGRLTKLLPDVSPADAKIIASDINPAMISYGKDKVESGSVQWMEIDAVALPFDDATFDCVTAQFGVMFYSDKVKAFKEAFRVLKPGGVFISNVWDEIRKNPMALIANDTLQHFFPDNTPAFYEVPFSYYDEKLIRNDLNAAGFEKITIDVVELSGYSHTAENAAKGLIQGTPTVTAIEERDATRLPLIMEYLESRISVQFGRQSLQVPLSAKVITAVK